MSRKENSLGVAQPTPDTGPYKDKALVQDDSFKDAQQEPLQLLLPRLVTALSPREEVEVTSPPRGRLWLPLHYPPSEDEMDDAGGRHTVVFPRFTYEEVS